MQKHIRKTTQQLIISMFVLVIMASTALAQDGAKAAESGSSGIGLLILLMGIGAVTFVGVTMIARQRTDNNNQSE